MKLIEPISSGDALAALFVVDCCVTPTGVTIYELQPGIQPYMCSDYCEIDQPSVIGRSGEIAPDAIRHAGTRDILRSFAINLRRTVIINLNQCPLFASKILQREFIEHHDLNPPYIIMTVSKEPKLLPRLRQKIAEQFFPISCGEQHEKKFIVKTPSVEASRGLGKMYFTAASPEEFFTKASDLLSSNFRIDHEILVEQCIGARITAEQYEVRRYVCMLYMTRRGSVHFDSRLATVWVSDSFDSHNPLSRYDFCDNAVYNYREEQPNDIRRISAAERQRLLPGDKLFKQKMRLVFADNNPMMPNRYFDARRALDHTQYELYGRRQDCDLPPDPSRILVRAYIYFFLPVIEVKDLSRYRSELIEEWLAAAPQALPAGRVEFMVNFFLKKMGDELPTAIAGDDNFIDKCATLPSLNARSMAAGYNYGEYESGRHLVYLLHELNCRLHPNRYNIKDNLWIHVARYYTFPKEVFGDLIQHIVDYGVDGLLRMEPSSPGWLQICFPLSENARACSAADDYCCLRGMGLARYSCGMFGSHPSGEQGAQSSGSDSDVSVSGPRQGS